MLQGEAATARTMTNRRCVPVALGARRYDILIGPGLIADAGRLIKETLGPARCAIVTDRNVAVHHLGAIEASLAAAGSHAGSIILPAGEATKCFAQLQGLCEQLLDLGLERKDTIVALGGGVIGDLTGFAASVLRRGIRFVQVPTSLLAQVDSSVGGKTGINTRHGKNLIGSFHQPSLVLADTDALATLPAREFRSGYAEVVKYGLLGDVAFFEWLDANRPGIFGDDAVARANAIETSCRMKAAIVARDETETGERMLLNLGHTFGHALEAWAGYGDRLLHGEAVAIGIGMAFQLSEQLALTAAGTAARVTRHLSDVGLPTGMSQIPGLGQNRPSASELMSLMAQDKKVSSGSMTFILARGIGEAFITREVATPTLIGFLERHCETG